MKRSEQLTGCPFHGSDLRPHLCSDCARLRVESPQSQLMQLEESDRGRLIKVQSTDARGKVRISFRVATEGDQLRNSSTDPWSQTWD